MVQIRNKYHLEKKRLENLKDDDNPSSYNMESKWPLYEQLSFLSEHIPVRRSFRKMRCKRRYSRSDFVKTEPESDGSDRGTDYEYKPGQKDHYLCRSNGKPKNYRYSGINSRTGRLPRQVYSSRHAHAIYQRRSPPPRTPPGSEKFNAFGKFLTSSLIELPEKEALTLVDQFTSEIVQAYMSKTVETDKPCEIPDDEVEITDGCNGHNDELITD